MELAVNIIELNLLFIIFIYFLEEGCTCVMAQACGAQKTICRSYFSTFTSGGSYGSGLEASNFTCWAFLSTPHLIFWAKGLSVNLKLAISATLATREAPNICPSLHLNAGVTEAFHCTWLLREYLLRIRTQLATLEQPAFYPLSHPPSQRSIRQRGGIKLSETN